MRKLWIITKSIFKESGKDMAIEKAASLSYYALYALGPMLLLFVFVGRLFVDEETAKEKVLQYFEEKLGPEATVFFDGVIENLVIMEAGWMFSIITVAVFLFGIYTFFNLLRRSFFEIFGVDFRSGRKKDRKILGYTFYIVHASILFILLFTVLMINIGSPIIYNVTINIFSEVVPVGVLNFLVTTSILILTATFLGLIYRFLSLKTLSLGNSLMGGLWASIMLAVLNISLSLYVTVSVTHSLYGLAGALVLLLVWVHYASFVLFLGAEAAKAHSKIKL